MEKFINYLYRFDAMVLVAAFIAVVTPTPDWVIAVTVGLMCACLVAHGVIFCLGVEDDTPQRCGLAGDEK